MSESHHSVALNMETNQTKHKRIKTTETKTTIRDLEHKMETEHLVSQKEYDSLSQTCTRILYLEQEVQMKFDEQWPLIQQKVEPYHTVLVNRVKKRNCLSNLVEASDRLHRDISSYKQYLQQLCQTSVENKDMQIQIGEDISSLAAYHMIDVKIISLDLEALYLDDINRMEGMYRCVFEDTADALVPNFQLFAQCRVTNAAVDVEEHAIFPAVFYNLYLQSDGAYTYANKTANNEKLEFHSMVTVKQDQMRTALQNLYKREREQKQSSYYCSLFPVEYLKCKSKINIALQLYDKAKQRHWRPVAVDEDDDMESMVQYTYHYFKQDKNGRLRHYLGEADVSKEDKYQRIANYINSCFDHWQKQQTTSERVMKAREKKLRDESRLYKEAAELGMLQEKKAPTKEDWEKFIEARGGSVSKAKRLADEKAEADRLRNNQMHFLD